MRTTSKCRNCFNKCFLKECACGCGSIITERDSNSRLRIFIVGHHSRLEKYKHNRTVLKGKDHYNWKGGKHINSQGYVMIKCEEHPRAKKSYRYRVREHIIVMERHLGRYLNEGEEIHHINRDKTDNRLCNLQLTNHKEHMRTHIKNGMKAEFYNNLRNGTIKIPRDLKTGRFIASRQN